MEVLDDPFEQAGRAEAVVQANVVEVPDSLGDGGDLVGGEGGGAGEVDGVESYGVHVWEGGGGFGGRGGG